MLLETAPSASAAAAKHELETAATQRCLQGSAAHTHTYKPQTLNPKP